ncbi:MAG TPA: hypothetical protein VMR59_00305 [Patescibacteria group bacterium]|jgi:hypothetical protein|nr:hypothetical protein [Patescibacteria group bacterium]
MDNLDTQEVNPNVPQSAVSSKEKPTTSDPIKFMTDFKASEFFRVAYGKFFVGKTISEEVTEAEKDEAFYNSQLAKDAFIEFAEKEERYQYRSSYFPAPIGEIFDCYIDQTKTLIQIQGHESRDLIINYDHLRAESHTQVASALQNAGIVPSYKFGKALARLALISLNLDNFESANVSDAVRLRRVLAA